MLTTIATIAPHHIAERTLPLLFSALPDTAPARDAVTERAKCWLILAILSKLCAQANLFETLVSRLTTKLDIFCVPKGHVDAQDLEPTSAYAQAILTTISRTLASKAEKGHTDVAKYVNRLVPQLFNLFIYSSILSDSQHMAATDYRVVSTAAEVITAIIQPLTLQYVVSFCVASINEQTCLQATRSACQKLDGRAVPWQPSRSGRGLSKITFEQEPQRFQGTSSTDPAM